MLGGKQLRLVALPLGGALMLGGCSDPTVDWRRPELRVCERFIAAQLKAPGSYRRSWHNIGDFPISRGVLAEATGDKAQAARATNPAIRRIYIQYRAANAFDQDVDGSALCLFPMTDAGENAYARDINASVDTAIAANEQRALAASQGQSVVAAECCTVEGFDRKRLGAIHPLPRGTVPAGRTL